MTWPEFVQGKAARRHCATLLKRLASYISLCVEPSSDVKGKAACLLILGGYVQGSWGPNEWQGSGHPHVFCRAFGDNADTPPLDAQVGLLHCPV